MHSHFRGPLSPTFPLRPLLLAVAWSMRSIGACRQRGCLSAVQRSLGTATGLHSCNHVLPSSWASPPCSRTWSDSEHCHVDFIQRARCAAAKTHLLSGVLMLGDGSYGARILYSRMLSCASESTKSLGSEMTWYVWGAVHVSCKLLRNGLASDRLISAPGPDSTLLAGARGARYVDGAGMIGGTFAAALCPSPRNDDRGKPGTLCPSGLKVDICLTHCTLAERCACAAEAPSRPRTLAPSPIAPPRSQLLLGCRCSQLLLGWGPGFRTQLKSMVFARESFDGARPPSLRP